MFIQCLFVEFICIRDVGLPLIREVILITSSSIFNIYKLLLLINFKALRQRKYIYDNAKIVIVCEKSIM